MLNNIVVIIYLIVIKIINKSLLEVVLVQGWMCNKHWLVEMELLIAMELSRKIIIIKLEKVILVNDLNIIFYRIIYPIHSLIFIIYFI